MFDIDEEILLANNIADADFENLKHITPSGIPQHTLRLKIGAVMLLIYNISVADGLCNGTRLQIVAFENEIIRCKILSGKSKGKYFDLPRLRFVWGGDPKAPEEGAIKCERVQFPLRPASAITINKSQGHFII